MLRRLLAIISIGGALLAAPMISAAESPKLGEYQTKGFLSDYSKLPAQAREDGSYKYEDPDADLRQYNKLLVDRIKVWFKEESEYKGIDADELKMLTDYFYSAIEKAVGDAYPMVSEPGPDVLRLRIAVTDLVPNKPEASVTTLIVPFLWVGEATAGAATKQVGATPFTGEATIELEALDSASGKQLAAYVDTEIGKKYAWDEGISEGVSSYMKAYAKWDYTKKAMDDWAQRIRNRLDEIHGRQAKAE